MAILDFYRRGNKKFTVAYFDHGTGNAEKALPIIEKYVRKHNLYLQVGHIEEPKPPQMSPEEFWRTQRYKFLCSLPDGDIVITAHNLGDCVEGWLFSTIHGTPKLMQAQTILSSYGEQSKILLRPFLTNRKENLIDWCKRHEVKWYEDKSNQDVNYPRNRIRHCLIDECLKVNPGLFNTIKRKILKMHDIQLIKSF